MEMIESFTATDTFVSSVLLPIVMKKPAVHALRGKKCATKSPDEKTGTTFYTQFSPK